MDAVNGFRSAWGDDAPSRELEALAAHLWLSGRLDLPDIRRARLLSETSDSRLLLLLMSCAHRAGAPRATTSGLGRILSDLDPWIADPEGFDAAALRARLEQGADGLREAWERVVSSARRDPRSVAEWCRRPSEDGAMVEFEDGPDPQWAFRRHAQAERDLERILLSRLREPLRPVGVGEARRILSEVLGGAAAPDPLQARAVALSLRAPLLVVSGGPGTGKTTVVVRILRALRRLLDLAPDRIALCAPTGRAHARLLESVGAATAGSGSDEDLARCAGGTLHSVLGARGDGSFRHGEDFPLPHRLVVVDESSMVDIGLFAALARSLRPDSTLVLLGDRDQLPSVEAGAVLADLCGGAGSASLSREVAEWTDSVLDGIAEPAPAQALEAAAHPLADRLVLLERSFRSAGEIVGLARAILSGEPGWAARLDEAPAGPGGPAAARLLGAVRDSLPGWFRSHMDDFRHWDSAGRDPGELARLLSSRIVLCAVHAGATGREAVCRELDGLLSRGGPGRHLPGRPVIATRNRPDLGLRNGDLGIVAARPEGLRAAFPAPGSIRWIDPALVPELEPAWALTVHKAQGSEFGEVLLAAPESDCPVLDRPALYTAVTRAKAVVRLCGDPALLERAALRVPDRPSRLRRILSNGG